MRPRNVSHNPLGDTIGSTGYILNGTWKESDGTRDNMHFEVGDLNLKVVQQLSDRQAFLSALMNSVPVYFRELFTYQLAFVIPVLGFFVGGAYAVVSIATGLIKLALVVVAGMVCSLQAAGLYRQARCAGMCVCVCGWGGGALEIDKWVR